MPTKTLSTWLGQNDLNASTGENGATEGPILGALKTKRYQAIEILNNYPKEKAKKYQTWLKQNTDAKITIHQTKIKSVVDYQSIYKTIEALYSKHKDQEIELHLSPGTSVMQQCWLLLGARHDLQLIRTSVQQGFEEIKLPFDIHAEFTPQKQRALDDKLTEYATQTITAPEFENIIHKSAAMAKVITRARVVALRDVPVLIQGESGTGKELFARAIHKASLRQTGPIVAINCGAIPENLVEATFFGTSKGAYTGALDKAGALENADGGTLFLDEIGEMPLAAQVKLLRALQERKVTRVGESKERSFDIRIIAATNRNLVEEVYAGRFREDLFHRLAVGVLRLPPLRERGTGKVFLAERLLEDINQKAAKDPGYQSKTLSAAAKKLIRKHPWFGNVRELQNTLLRASIWSQGKTLEGAALEEALLPAKPKDDQILGRAIDEDFDIEEVISEVERHYFERAINDSNQVKAKAAALLGLNSATTLSNRMKRAGLET